MTDPQQAWPHYYPPTVHDVLEGQAAELQHLPKEEA